MADLNSEGSQDRLQASLTSIHESLPMMTKSAHDMTYRSLNQPPTSTLRRTEGLDDLIAYLQQSEAQRGTFLYLGYGSNLSNEKFRGARGIKPLSQVNVQVPTLRLTFDLPGIPYSEPCFANSGRRDPESDRPSSHTHAETSSEKTPLLSLDFKKDGYHKDRWHKGLIGVVYEVTPEDYAHIIETEGGGASYQDITVDCHPLPLDEPDAVIPQDPTFPAFKAHTLFAPAVDPNDPPPKDGGRFQRPDVSYAQPSARYLKLMTDGAAELCLPMEYQNYLLAIRSYTMTTAKQRVGAFVLLAMWGPFIGILFGLGKMFADDKGRIPGWLRELLGAVFKAVWASYDKFFQPIFGDGERTITDEDMQRKGQGKKQRIPNKLRKKNPARSTAPGLAEKETVISQIV